MRFSRISVVLLFAIVVLSKADSGEADETQAEEEEFGCNKLSNVLRRYHECFYSANVTGFFINFSNLVISGVVTGESLLSEVASLCSDRKIEEAYEKCTKDLLSVCPDLSAIITDVVREKVSFLCENNQPSPWIRAVVNEDYLLASACLDRHYNEVVETARDCTMKANAMTTESLTVAEARSLYKLSTSNVFQCTFAPYSGNDTLPCGSKKKVMLLTYWIYSSTSGGPLRPPIGQEAMNQLRLMMS